MSTNYKLITFKEVIYITRNQIEYWRYKESKRSNLANEEQKRNELAEVKRNNLAVLAETNRANLAREAETHRANVANEQQRALDSSRSWILGLRGQAETERTHRENERLTEMSITETQRANRAREELQRRDRELQAVGQILQQRTIVETERANRTKESQYLSSLAETQRANLARESQNLLSLAETSRSNRVSEQIRFQQNALTARNIEENRRHSLAVEGETHRANVANESIRMMDIGLRTLSDVVQIPNTGGPGTNGGTTKKLITLK